MEFPQGWCMKRIRECSFWGQPHYYVVNVSMIIALCILLVVCSPNCPSIPGEHSNQTLAMWTISHQQWVTTGLRIDKESVNQTSKSTE